jgi:hypothetical protein
MDTTINVLQYDRLAPPRNMTINDYIDTMDRIYKTVNENVLVNREPLNNFFLYSVAQVHTKKVTPLSHSIFVAGDSFILPCYKSSSFTQCMGDFHAFIGYDFQPYVFRTYIDVTKLKGDEILFIGFRNGQNEVILNFGLKLIVTNVSKSYVMLSDNYTCNCILIDCAIDYDYNMFDVVDGVEIRRPQDGGGINILQPSGDVTQRSQLVSKNQWSQPSVDKNQRSQPVSKNQWSQPVSKNQRSQSVNKNQQVVTVDRKDIIISPTNKTNQVNRRVKKAFEEIEKQPFNIVPLDVLYKKN